MGLVTGIHPGSTTIRAVFHEMRDSSACWMFGFCDLTSASANGPETTIFVTLSLRTSGSISPDNAGYPYYSLNYGGTDLGTFKTTEPGLYPNVHVPGVEIVGTVDPSIFTGMITIMREKIAFKTYQNNVFLSDDPGPDPSPDELRDDDPQSDGSNGKIYDLDAPGIKSGSQASVGDILRLRAVFRQWAELSNGSKVADDLCWFSRVSIKKTATGDILWNDVENDNIAGMASCGSPPPTTWDLN